MCVCFFFFFCWVINLSWAHTLNIFALLKIYGISFVFHIFPYPSYMCMYLSLWKCGMYRLYVYRYHTDLEICLVYFPLDCVRMHVIILFSGKFRTRTIQGCTENCFTTKKKKMFSTIFVFCPWYFFRFETLFFVKKNIANAFLHLKQLKNSEFDCKNVRMYAACGWHSWNYVIFLQIRWFHLDHKYTTSKNHRNEKK